MRGVDRAVGQDGNAKRLLTGIDLTIARNTITHIVGPSGSGKSSLLRLINRLDEPTSGTIEVLGKPSRDWPVRELRRRVAMVLQEPSLLDRTVEENLRLPGVLHGLDNGDPRAAVEQVGLSADMLKRAADQLSVGQKQRVALARAIITKPDVLLLDEPTSALDPRTAEELLDQLIAIRQQRELTIIMVTHRLEEARRLGGQMVVMIDGTLAASGEAAALLDDPPNGVVRQFLIGGDDETD